MRESKSWYPHTRRRKGTPTENCEKRRRHDTIPVPYEFKPQINYLLNEHAMINKITRL